MREILFRGKRKTNNEWVYGNYCGAEYLINEGIEHFIIEIPRNGSSSKVIPETVGQYTGLTDKNGNKIFEGDIIKIYLYDDIRLANYEIGNIKYDETKARYIFCTEDGCYSIDNSNEYEVIGNIHDNPELLKGGEG